MTKILIIEDEKSLREAYSYILNHEGYQVETATNGEEALAAFKAPPDLVLLDLQMPQMDGVTFLKNLNAVKKYPEVRIIVFSNYNDQSEIDKSFKYGATRYILKAWLSPKELVKVVKETLAQKVKV